MLKSNFRTFSQSLGDHNHIFSHLIIRENLVFCSLEDRITVVEAHNGNRVRHLVIKLKVNFRSFYVQIYEIFDPREWDLGSLCLNSRKQLAVIGFFPGTYHLTVWKMEEPTDFRLLHQEYFSHHASNTAVWSDEDYIALAFDSFSKNYEVRLISTTTFETERTFSFGEALFHYDRGLLFVAKSRGDTIRSVPINRRKNCFT
jgi:hypothetical protein